MPRNPVHSVLEGLAHALNDGDRPLSEFGDLQSVTHHLPEHLKQGWAEFVARLDSGTPSKAVLVDWIHLLSAQLVDITWFDELMAS